MTEEKMNNPQEPSQGEENGPQGEEMTFDQVLASNPKYQKEFDRRVTKGINTALTKERDRLATINNKDIPEEQRMAAMNAEELADYTAKKAAADLARREQAISRREMLADTRDALTAKGLPGILASIVDYANRQTMEDSTAKIINAFNVALAESINDRLKGGKPPKDARTEGTNHNKPDAIRRAMGL